MGKIKTLRRRKASFSKKLAAKPVKKTLIKLKDESKFKEYDPTVRLLNKKSLGSAIVECLIDNDPEGVIEMIEDYLETLNKSKISKESGLSRSTVYTFLKGKNPTIKTLAKIVSACCHS